MPRLADQEYLNRHHFLAQAWTDRRLYGILPVHEQWRVHAYYLPTKDLSDEQLLQQRQLITKERPTLPRQAGRAFTRMFKAFEVAIAYADGDEKRFRQALWHFTHDHKQQDARIRAYVAAGGRKSGRIRVVAIANPKSDLKKFAWALIGLAEQMAKEKRDDEQHRSRAA